MDPHHRGRSPSQGHQPHISQNNSPSPHAGYQNVTGLGLDGASLVPDYNHTTTFDHSNNPSFDLSPNYLSHTHSQYSQQPEIANHTFLQPQGLPSNATSPQFGPQSNIYPQDNLALGNSAADNGGFNAQGFQNNGLGAQSIDPSILLDSQISGQQLHDQSIDPTNLMNQMSTAAHSPTPPHLLQGDMRHSSNSPHASPSINQGAFTPSGHSRQHSLDPSAAFAHHNEWHGMQQFRGHRRAPSDTYSDVSSSAQPSPYLGNADGFDDSNASPLLGAQQDPMFQDVLNFGQFSLSDNQAGISPGHSPAISPRLMPQQQQLPPFTASNNYGLAPIMNNRSDGMDMFPGTGQEPFPALSNDHAPDYGASDQMSPPEINIDFAPPSRQQSFEPPKPEDSSNALSPPDRNRSRNRMRAKSDPFSSASMRAGQPASPPSDPATSLHPDAAKLSVSRPSTPGGVGKTSRRSSTSSIPHRDYMLGLADPNRPNPAHPASTASSPGGHSESAASVTSATGSKRTQKHPATFQCSLCPKRFTRAYNLRSHLRTHTDERPFVCSVCGKAFARQHDRKRHEGLHSGEKKFVCRGVLKDGGSWGCSRRFARADALGRHFRSEAGRVCIRPLLEEEAQERGLDLGILSGQAQQQQHPPGMDHFNPMMQPGQPQGLGMMMPQHPHGSPFDPLGQQPGLGVAHGGPMMGFALPQSLLQQYPALAGIQWDALPPSNNDDNIDDDAISGRSSFDAQSSGGDMYDDNSWRNEQTLSDYDGRGG